MVLGHLGETKYSLLGWGIARGKDQSWGFQGEERGGGIMKDTFCWALHCSSGKEAISAVFKGKHLI